MIKTAHQTDDFKPCPKVLAYMAFCAGSCFMGTLSLAGEGETLIVVIGVVGFFASSVSCWLNWPPREGYFGS